MHMNLTGLHGLEAAGLKPTRIEKRLPEPLYQALKRVFDVGVVLAAAPLLLPIGLICALAIKLESPGGSVFFRQKRTGKDGRRFGMYKFRTMVPNADALKEQLRSQSLVAWPDFKLENDPRVTKVGRLLRKTSLDEIPQLLNVLTGDMSLVGPRPTSFDLNVYSLWHCERLEVRPGVTGLWQILGRGRIEFDDRVRLDIAYIENRSFMFDMRILLQTVPALLRGD